MSNIEAKERHFRHLLRRGVPIEHARRLATGYLFGVGVRTATSFLAGQGTLLDQFGDDPGGRDDLALRLKLAKERYGHTPNPHDVYDPTLAPAVGHPDGFIPHDDVAGHLRRVEAKRKSGVEPESNGLAEDIVEDFRQGEIAKNPDLAHKDQNDLREQIRDKHSFKRRA